MCLDFYLQMRDSQDNFVRAELDHCKTVCLTDNHCCYSRRPLYSIIKTIITFAYLNGAGQAFSGTYRHQRTTFKSWFSPSSMEFQAKQKSSSLAASVFTLWANSLASHSVVFICTFILQLILEQFLFHFVCFNKNHRKILIQKYDQRQSGYFPNYFLPGILLFMYYYFFLILVLTVFAKLVSNSWV